MAKPGRRQGHERMDELKKLVKSLCPESSQKGSSDSLKDDEPVVDRKAEVKEAGEGF